MYQPKSRQQWLQQNHAHVAIHASENKTQLPVVKCGMNCTELDGFVDDAYDFFAAHDGGFAVAIAALVVVSGLLLVKGEQLVRPLSALVAGVGDAPGGDGAVGGDGPPGDGAACAEDAGASGGVLPRIGVPGEAAGDSLSDRCERGSVGPLGL